MHVNTVTRPEVSPSPEPSIGGYTVLPNALLRVWIPALSGSETTLLTWVIQDTLAWHREYTKPTSYRLIARMSNLHRHSIERAVGVLVQIGLIAVCDADEDPDGCGQMFTINSVLLQNPPMELDMLVQKLDQLRKGDWSKNGTNVVPKKDAGDPKIGPVLVQKKDRSYKEEIKELKESKKLAGSESQELDEEIWERIARSRLSTLGGNPLDNWTVANIRAQIERLTDVWQAKEVLETMEHKCSEFARNPRVAETWGLVVRVVRDSVTQILTQSRDCAQGSGGGGIQKPWSWMTAEERTSAREEAERIA